MPYANALKWPLVLAFLAATAAVAVAAPAYKLDRTIPLGAGERWDYATFDGAAGRVYVAHGDHVTVVDLNRSAVIGQIGPLPGGTHGIGVFHETNTGYTDDGEAGIAAAFNLNTFKISTRIPTADDADGIVFDPASQHMFVVNGDSGSITVIDPKKNMAVATIRGGGGLEAAAPDGKGKLFVDGAEKGEMITIDTASNTVLAHYPMPGCQRPHGIAVDGANRRVFATCVNRKMMVLDADSGKVVASLPIGSGTDGAAFDPVRHRALSSNGDGTLSVVQEKDADHFDVSTVKTMPGARTIAIDPKSGAVFLPTADVAKVEPPAKPGGRSRVTYVANSAKLLVLTPQ